MIIISYFTEKTPYEQVAKDLLLKSLSKFDLKYDVQGVPDMGSWYHNTGYKPTFILDKLLQYKEDVCFLDADATILRYPKLLEEIPDEYDVAASLLDWHLMWRKEEGHDKRELLSGTMVWKYKPSTIELLEKYKEAVKNNIHEWEQRKLQQILEANPQYKLYDLPPEYCTIIKHNGDLPHYITNPVIVHWQKSRNYKNWHKRQELGDI